MPRPTFPYRTFSLRRFGGLYTEADPRNLPPGASPRCQDCDFNTGQVFQRAGVTNVATQFNTSVPVGGWRGLGQARVGASSQLSFALDASGQLWYEDASNAGIWNLMCGPGGIAPTVINQPSLTLLNANTRAYLFFSNLIQGTEQPRQWDGNILARVSKCGPGSAPRATTPPTGTSYGASAIQFGVALNITSAIWGNSLGSTPSNGNNLYLLFGTGTTGNVAQFNVGDYLYVDGLPNLASGTNLNGTYQVASMGTYGTQEYVQVVLRESSAVVTTGLSGVTVQRTRAAIVLAQPSTAGAFTVGALTLLNGFPGSILNNQFIISVPTLANLSLNSTSCASGVALLTASLINGNRFWWVADTQYNLGQQLVQNSATVPAAGSVWVCIQQGRSGATVPTWPANPTSGTTVTDNGVVWSYVPGGKILVNVGSSTNGNGVFNFQQVAVGSAAANGNDVNISIPLTTPDVANAVENGVITAGGGFSFEFEPALWTLGHPNLSPIFGSATGNVTGQGQATQQAVAPTQPPPGPQQVTGLANLPMNISPIVRNRIIASNPLMKALSMGSGPILDPPAVPGTMLPSALNDVAPGLRWAICMFLTKSGHITPASPPHRFYPLGGYVNFTQLPIGPPDTIARIIAISQANAAIGGPYFYVPQDTAVTTMNIAVPNIVGPDSNTASTATSTPNQPAVQPVAVPATTISGMIVWDNASASSGLLTLSDTVLVSSVNVSTDGQNYMRTKELGECMGATQYSGRNFYFGERSKIDNFVNPTFDGGYVNVNEPAGWAIENQVHAVYKVDTSLLLPASCFSLKISNDTGGTVINPTGVSLGGAECLSQSAGFDVFSAPVILPNTNYGVRLIMAAAATQGSLVVELYSPGLGQSWQFEQAFTSEVPAEYTGALNNPMWAAVPADLQLRVYPMNLAGNQSVNVERVELFDTYQPVLNNRVTVSYANDPEGIDQVSGAIDISQWTNEPIKAVFRWLSNVIIATDRFTFTVTDNGATEPSGWAVTVVSDEVGIAGPRAWCLSNEFVLIADRNGVYTFDGGNHVKISQEMQSVWNQIFPPSLNTVWLQNDLRRQRLFVGAPLKLPNIYLPSSAADQTPALPNTILMCNYMNLMTGSELAGGIAVSVSMFTGGLLMRDNKRKWCPWTIPAAMGAFILLVDGSQQLWLADRANTNINQLTQSDGANNDNGLPIPQSYVTYGFNDEQVSQGLQWGDLHKNYQYMTANLQGNGKLLVTGLPETLQSEWPINMPPYPVVTPMQEDANLPLNMRANALFLQFATDLQVTSNFSLKALTLAAMADGRIPVSGR
ncbi:MAG: hypothetical protein ACRD22_01190 [Terriglobia bacterium]